MRLSPMLIALCLAGPVLAQTEDKTPSTYPYTATMTDGVMLLASAKIGDRPTFGCTVPKGSRLQVLGAEESDFPNVEALRVKVLNGPCAGSTGYVGASHLQLVDQ